MRLFLSISFCIAMGLFQFAAAQQKHALIVAISEYPKDDAKNQYWKKLSSDNDVRLIKDELQVQHFPENQIQVIQNEQATVKGIQNAFDKLIAAVSPGDLVMVHFSGHGQQVRDLSGDEEDNYDEAFVCFSAPVKCYEGYTGQDHLLDDDMGKWFEAIRLKLGANGHLLALFDTCHSGTATRGSNETIARGGEGRLEFDCNTQMPAATQAHTEVTGWSELLGAASTQKASMVVISGCRADETNYEVSPGKGDVSYGALSYSFVQVLKKAGRSSASYADVLDELRINIANTLASDKNKSQTPQIEGNVYSKIFNGAALEPSQYLQVYTSGKKAVEIEGGFLAGHGVGDSIAFYALSNLKTPVAIGGITTLHETRSGVQLNKVLPNNYAQYKAKQVYSAAANLKRTLKITGESPKLKEVKALLDKHPSFVVAAEGPTDFTLALDKKSFTIFSSDGKTPLRSMKPTPIDSLHILKQRLSEITRVEVLRERTQIEASMAVEVRCVRLTPCKKCDFREDTLDLKCTKIKNKEIYLTEDKWPNNELYALHDSDYICLYAINNEPKSVYITPIEISPNGKIFMQGPKENISYHKIQPSKEPTPICILRIAASDGYGPETIKMIVSKEEVNLANTPIEASGTDLSKQIYFPEEQLIDNSLASMFGFRKKDGINRGLDGDKDMSIINIPLIMK